LSLRLNRGAARQDETVSRRYAASLKAHLASGRKPSLRRAGDLGHEAIAAGLGSSDLAKIHEQALVRLVASGESPQVMNGKIARAAPFFLKALASFERTDRAAVAANGHLSRLNGSMNRRTLELAGAKRQLKREFVRRKFLEAALKKSEKHYSELLLKSRHMQEHLHRLSRKILSAQEQERKRISRELHDEIGQTLTAVNVKLATLKKEASVNNKDLKKAISSTQSLVERSMNTVHRFARELRPPVLDDLGLIPALHAYMRVFAKRSGVHVRFKAFAAVEKMHNDRRTALYRVAQEAFTNIGKHAHATLVNVNITKVKRLVLMEIHDNGRSFDASRLAARKIVRLGLLGMRERIEMVGGTFSVESEPGRGTIIRAMVPLGGRG
jgi:signal transduction histidine kinase